MLLFYTLFAPLFSFFLKEKAAAAAAAVNDWLIIYLNHITNHWLGDISCDWYYQKKKLSINHSDFTPFPISRFADTFNLKQLIFYLFILINFFLIMLDKKNNKEEDGRRIN